MKSSSERTASFTLMLIDFKCHMHCMFRPYKAITRYFNLKNILKRLCKTNISYLRKSSYYLCRNM